MTLCVIDMGSNSFKRIVGALVEGRYVQHGMIKKTLGVGDDLARHGRISDPKLAEIEQTLSELEAACADDGARRVLAIGTAAFREAPNGGRVVEIAAKLGIPMEIASEECESRLAYLAGSLGRDGYAVIDNGSRSIELASKEAGRELRYSVFDLGYRVAFRAFFAGAETFAALGRKKEIDRALPRLVVAATLAADFGYDGIELTARELGTGLIIEAGLRANA